MRSQTKGFTLIELLIVVVIIGILAAIALPKFGQTREAAYYTTMKADLNNLRSAQEMYYQTSGDFEYADDLDALDFTASSGVTSGAMTAICRCAASASRSSTCRSASAGGTPAATRSRISVPFSSRTSAWVAAMPTPSRTCGTRLPTQGTREVTAIPISPVSLSIAAMLNVPAYTSRERAAASWPLNETGCAAARTMK